MTKGKNIYYEGVKVVKRNIGSSVAILFFMASCLVLFYLVEKILFSTTYLNYYTNFGVNINFVWSTFAIITFVIISPLELGVKKWYYDCAKGKKTDICQMFYFFTSVKMYIKAVAIKVNIAIRLLIIYSLVFTPIILLSILVNYPIARHAVQIDLAYLTVVIMMMLALLLGLVCAVYFSLKYFLAYYIFFDSSNQSLIKAIRTSKKIMQNNKSKIIAMYIKLFPLYLLCIFVIPLIIVVPYTYAITALKANELLKTQTER